MKKIILIGKVNRITEQLEILLSSEFRVHVTSNDPEVLQELMGMVDPDLVVVNLAGIHEADSKFFSVLGGRYSMIPVLTVGSSDERERIKAFNGGKEYDHVMRPITQASIIEGVNRLLDAGDPPLPEENDSFLSEDEDSPFPSHYDAHESGKTERVMPRPKPVPGRRRRKKILVVDDNGQMLRILKDMLEDQYDLELVTSGIKAMTSIVKDRPDIVLLDYEMPVCDGRQTLEMIRSDEDFLDLPVVFLTGINDREHIKQVLKLSPQGYLLKPPSRYGLLKTIEGVIGK